MGAAPTRPRRMEGVAGVVSRGPFGAGSKSAREAFWLETEEGRFELRRKSGPAYGDRKLNEYVGKRVSCDGFLVGHTLLTEHIKIVG